MLSLTLKAQDEYLWTGKLDEPLSKAFMPKEGQMPQYPLYHQRRTYHAEEPIIINTHNTGTGKTKAALLRLLRRASEVGFDRLRPSHDNVLFIAPTNELLAQHTRDIQQFCGDCQLPYRVLPITKKDLDEYCQQPGISETRLRRGAMLHMLLNDASKVHDDRDKRATVYVVNPDIFYYAIYFSYRQFDRAALFNNFLTGFNYLVIDELHYYSPKQFATFLFFIKLSQHYGYISSAFSSRQFCLLTATPRPQVKDYLDRLGIPIQWIVPGDISPEDQPYVRPTGALTPVQLEVYNTEELQSGDQQGGLFPLAVRERNTIRHWLDQGMDGAIISSSLGTINNIHHALKTIISPTEEMGRITGAQEREQRQMAKKRPLILATPTVDIGYNFERETPKSRQNIDFLLLDAFSDDELVQRIGRAGRVLGKPQKDQPSTVLTVVEPALYKVLENYARQEMERATFAHLAADALPKRNDFYAYLRTGAIIEAFRPFFFIRQGTSESDFPELEAFFVELQQLFTLNGKITPFKQIWYRVKYFNERDQHYGMLRSIPSEAFDRLATNRLSGSMATEVQDCLQTFVKRLRAGHQQQKVGNTPAEVCRWIQEDLRKYFIEKARFSFRDSFQPPLALIYDPGHLHSSSDVAPYNALHLMKYYRATYYDTLAQWQEQCLTQAPADIDSAAVYCQLHELLDTPLQIGLKLDAGNYTQDEWEETFAYQVTALYGLEIVVRNDHHGVHSNLRSLLRTQFVPAFAALSATTSRTASYVRRLQRQGRFFPLPMDVTFCDGKTRTYSTILGTMAFQVCAEIPPHIIRSDRRTTQRENDTLLIC
jgi:CRISPR-associated endonuclease/helicase Cas3